MFCVPLKCFRSDFSCLCRFEAGLLPLHAGKAPSVHVKGPAVVHVFSSVNIKAVLAHDC